MLCEKSTFNNLPRARNNKLFTLEVKSAIEQHNINEKEIKLKKKIKESGSNALSETDARIIRKLDKISPSTKSGYGSIQNELLTIHSKICCNSECENCGIDKRLTLNKCPIEYGHFKRNCDNSRLFRNSMDNLKNLIA